MIILDQDLLSLLYLNYQVKTFYHLVLPYPEDQGRVVVYHRPVLKLTLGLHQHNVPLLGPPALLDPVHQDALLDVPVSCDISPVILKIFKGSLTTCSTDHKIYLCFQIRKSISGQLIVEYSKNKKTSWG